MDENKRLAVAIALPAVLLAAMLFAPLDIGTREPAVAGDPGPQASGSAQPPRATTPPEIPVALTDWPDVLQLSGITYSAGLLNSGRALRDDDLRDEVGRVSARLSGRVRPAGYVLQNGDAAYLDQGTPLYAVNGYRPTFRLAARRSGRVVLYEAIANPAARSGRDLLDVDGRVRSIAVNVSDPRAEGRAIDREDEVASLVRMVMDAQVRAGASLGQRTAYVSFRLQDGTAVTLQYSSETGNLSRGLTGLPREFGAAIASPR